VNNLPGITVSSHLADYFKALGHPTRLQIIELLREGEKCVCEIIPALQMEQSNISRHLAILKKEGVLSSEKRGLKVIYSCKNEDVYRMIDLSKTILGAYWEERRKPFE
jgi:DNA-binding transcriptional ArsR family regulator